MGVGVSFRIVSYFFQTKGDSDTYPMMNEDGRAAYPWELEA